MPAELMDASVDIAGAAGGRHAPCCGIWAGWSNSLATNANFGASTIDGAAHGL